MAKIAVKDYTKGRSVRKDGMDDAAGVTKSCMHAQVETTKTRRDP